MSADNAVSPVASNIRRFMNEQNISRKKICEDLNIKYTTFCDWINAKSSPKPEALNKLAGYLGIRVSDFFIETDDPTDLSYDRFNSYASQVRILDMKLLKDVTDDQIKELLKQGFRFKHKTLEEYIREKGGVLTVSSEFDTGEPVGGEIW